jgi:hypothetical protein
MYNLREVLDAPILVDMFATCLPRQHKLLILTLPNQLSYHSQVLLVLPMSPEDLLRAEKQSARDQLVDCAAETPNVRPLIVLSSDHDLGRSVITRLDDRGELLVGVTRVAHIY